jgi:hypothetical protein
MAAKTFARSFVLNVTAAAAGLAGTFYITWFFGLSEFAYYTINLAKLSLILLGAELLPNSFTLYRLQEDERFTSAVPVFYLLFAIVAAVAAGMLVVTGLLDRASWFMVAFAFTSALQRYFDTQAQASGRVDAFFWIPAASNIARLALLAGLSQLRIFSIPDALWASLAVGSVIGQAVMLSRFPEFLDRAAYIKPLAKLHYLWSIRSSYYGYYVNSVLKRLRDTFLPLFCDLVIPSKSEIGRLLVYTRANEAVCGQVRVLEAFMVNRGVRENLRHLRRRIFWTIGPVGQIAIAGIALALIYRHGIGPTDVALAFVAGLFIYPYIAELFWRNDALASFRPRQVTISLLCFMAGLALPPLVAWALGRLSIAILVASYVLGQTLSAATYRLFPGRAPADAGQGQRA